MTRVGPSPAICIPCVANMHATEKTDPAARMRRPRCALVEGSPVASSRTFSTNTAPACSLHDSESRFLFPSPRAPHAACPNASMQGSAASSSSVSAASRASSRLRARSRRNLRRPFRRSSLCPPRSATREAMSPLPRRTCRATCRLLAPAGVESPPPLFHGPCPMCSRCKLKSDSTLQSRSPGSPRPRASDIVPAYAERPLI